MQRLVEADFTRDLGEGAGQAKQACAKVAQQGAADAVLVADFCTLHRGECVRHSQERTAHAVQDGVRDGAC